ncbi:DNA adenine methylase [Leifsonia aquatica]|uniref:DNA adenine methylase n=1 Tax=Leifsonia aquatica TaxID=144185 RepID=UPI000467F657|nr:DNA adenine methylase [Leifsonia aquatica]
MTGLKPPFPYFGGKQRIAEQIVARFPKHDHYVEPYCGGLSVLLAKAPSKFETVNDLDGDVMTFWRVLRDQPEDLERLCALTPHSREESLLARDRRELTDLERARRVWVALTQRRGGQLQATGWRYNIDPSTASTLSVAKYLNAYVSRIAPAADRLRTVALESRPALEIIDAYGGFEDVLIYVDPPYLGATRGSSNPYRHEMKTAALHTELLEALRTVRANVVLSGYPSDLYDRALAGWWREEIGASTGQSNGRFDSARTEVLWANYDLTMHSDAALDFGDWDVTA